MSAGQAPTGVLPCSLLVSVSLVRSLFRFRRAVRSLGLAPASSSRAARPCLRSDRLMARPSARRVGTRARAGAPAPQPRSRLVSSHERSTSGRVSRVTGTTDVSLVNSRQTSRLIKYFRLWSHMYMNMCPATARARTAIAVCYSSVRDRL